MGKFELANNGTIFLDEIGDMPIELQASLLRVIQNREVIRIGGKSPKPIDVRIISATNVNLPEKVLQGEFRTDLYYRLNIISISLKPLRDRIDDIPVLTQHFINVYNSIMNKRIYDIDDDAMDLLIHHSWPGNTRELENVIERAINLADGHIIKITDLPQELRNKEQIIIDASQENIYVPGMTLSDYEKKIICDALLKSNGNINEVGRVLQIPRRTLYRKLEKHGIDYNSYRINSKEHL